MKATQYLKNIAVRYFIIVLGVLISAYTSILLWPFPLARQPKPQELTVSFIQSSENLFRFLYGYTLWCMYSGLILFFLFGPLVQGRKLAHIAVILILSVQGVALLGFASAAGRSGLLMGLGAIPSIVALIVAIRYGNGDNDRSSMTECQKAR